MTPQLSTVAARAGEGANNPPPDAAHLAMYAAEQIVRAEIYQREPVLASSAGLIRETAIKALRQALAQLEQTHVQH